MIYLVEAKEVLDGWGCIEDVAFGRHHQDEAIQCLNIEEKKSVIISFTCFYTHRKTKV